MLKDRSFYIFNSVEVPMRDGCLLRANIWLPAKPGTWPVLLQRTPYRKEDLFSTQYISAMEFDSALKRGYVIIVQDTRGRYGSDGHFMPFVNEQADGEDTISWIKAQDFCNGQVIMFGASYVGATQVLAAAANPDGLLAMSPHLTTGRHGETWCYRGGAIELSFLYLWMIDALAGPDLERRKNHMPKDEIQKVQALLSEFQQDPQKAFLRLPLVDDDICLLAPYIRDWFSVHKSENSVYDQEQLKNLEKTSLAVLVSCGWNDIFLEGALELFVTMRSRWGEVAKVPDRLIIGPWSHGNPSAWQGDVYLGPLSSTADLLNQQLNFFDSVCANRMPETAMVTYFRSGSNSWHTASDWPIPAVEYKDIYLCGNGLQADPVESEGLDWQYHFISDPLNPVPTIGGATFLPGLLLAKNSGPKNQRLVEEREDILLFTSDIFVDSVEVTGIVEVVLWVSSTGKSADWTARLCEVDEDGNSIGLVDGVYRQYKAQGQPTKIKIKLGHISHLFKLGKKMRLQIASSNFPRFDRNPQSGVASSLAQKNDFFVSKHTVYAGEKMKSHLILPYLKVF